MRGGLLVFVARLRAVLRLSKYALLIRRSGVFDAAFYLRQCPGDPSARLAPILHYLTRGAAAGFDPSPYFDTSFYVEQYPDVAASGKNALVHYLRHGARERRASSPRLAVTAPVARARGVPLGNPLEHALARSDGKAQHPLVSARIPRTIRGDLPDRALDLDRPVAARRFLVVDERVPAPDRSSASVRMFAILKLLRRLGHPVTFVSHANGRGTRYERAVRRLGIEVLHGFEPALKHLAERGREYSVAILSSVEIAERYLMPVRAYALEAQVVYDSVDLHWVRLERAAAVTGDPRYAAEAARLKKLECLCATAADLTLTVTADESALLRGEVPGARIELLPNVHACPGTSRPWAKRRDLLFIGAYSHAPNVDAVEWFVEEILPLVHRRLPGTVLRVVGSDPPRRLRRLASATVDVLGHVRSVEPLFEASRVFVSPLRFGAGMKGKIGQSMSLGLPVVTTSIGAEGMGLSAGENALVADEPAAFAEAVVRLCTDEALWSRLSEASTRHVRDHLSEEVASKRLASLFPAQPALEEPAAETVPVFVRIRP